MRRIAAYLDPIRRQNIEQDATGEVVTDVFFPSSRSKEKGQKGEEGFLRMITQLVLNYEAKDDKYCLTKRGQRR